MPTLEQIQSNYPELLVTGGPKLVSDGLISQQEEAAFYNVLRELHVRREAGEEGLSFPHLNPIKAPPELIISILLSQNKFTALVVAVEAVPPMDGHYHFCIDSITVSGGNDAGVMGYVRKEVLDNIRAQTSIDAIMIQNNAFASREFCNNLSKILRSNNFADCAQFFLNPELISRSFLEFKRKLYAFHTEGFLTTLSKRHSGLVTFMYEKFHDYLSLSDLVSLRLTCKKDKDLPITNLTSQNLRLR